MKLQVPAFNVLLSLAYLATSGVLLYVLKMAFKSIGQIRSRSTSVQITSKMMAKAWLKRYTLVCSFLEKDKKYLLKEYLILSTYAAACFNINHIVIWPVVFILFMLPLAIVLYEVTFGLARHAPSPDVNVANAISGEVVIENVAIEVVRQQKKGKQVKKSFLQMATLAIFCFVGALLFSLCQMKLINSTSNSGELNIQSLFIILTMDQLLMRPSLGLSVFATLKVLEVYKKIDLQANLLVLELCSAQVEAQMAQGLQADRAKSAHEITSSPLKRQHQGAMQPEVKPSEQIFIDLQHLQPYGNQDIQAEEQLEVPQIQNRQDQREEKQKKAEQSEQCAYLTTPQKQMFEHEVEEESQQASHETIVRTCLEEKQNCEHSINCSDQFGGPMQFQEFIYAKKPLETNQKANMNRKGESVDFLGGVVGQKGRRKNKRVLKISGTSPYLQYLPNMLKKVDKFKHMMKQSKAPAPKML